MGFFAEGKRKKLLVIRAAHFTEDLSVFGLELPNGHVRRLWIRSRRAVELIVAVLMVLTPVT